jgi:two-component system OmpR family response regulator
MIMLDVESALIEEGFEVVCANSAAQAISRYDADPAKFKALITDIRLGDGQSGWDIGRHVREIFPPIPVIYISGDSSKDWRAQGVPDSIMIEKPFVMAQIITALTQLLNQSSQSPSAEAP